MTESRIQRRYEIDNLDIFAGVIGPVPLDDDEPPHKQAAASFNIQVHRTMTDDEQRDLLAAIALHLKTIPEAA